MSTSFTKIQLVNVVREKFGFCFEVCNAVQLVILTSILYRTETPRACAVLGCDFSCPLPLLLPMTPAVLSPVRNRCWRDDNGPNELKRTDGVTLFSSSDPSLPLSASLWRSGRSVCSGWSFSLTMFLHFTASCMGLMNNEPFLKIVLRLSFRGALFKS